jgi:Rrf2 family protein
MFIRREGDYAVRCVLFLARERHGVMSSGEISRSASIPRSFLAKILQRLAKRGIVESIQGISGGFRLAKPPSRINLLEVIEAAQGPSAINICVVDKKNCDLSAACAVHPVWMELRDDLEKKLRRKTFARILAGAGKTTETEKGGAA